MPKLFMLEDQVHHADDPECPACSEGYPERCQCGGLMHATGVATEENSDVVPITRCDQCGRSKEDLEEVA